MEPEGLLSCSQEPAAGPYPEPHEPVHTPSPISLRSILILCSHLCLDFPSGRFTSCFPTKTLHALVPHVYYMPCPFHTPWLDQSNDISLLRVMKLLIMEPTPPSYYFIPLNATYSPQHSVLKHRQSIFIP
jgi:hypothetical protein